MNKDFSSDILSRIDDFYKVIDGKKYECKFKYHITIDYVNPMVLDLLNKLGIKTNDLSFDYTNTVEYNVLMVLFNIAEQFDDANNLLLENPSNSINRMNDILTKYYTFITEYASAKYHGNFKMGLLIHSMNVLKNAIRMAPIYTVDMETFDMIPILFHDLCKVGKYIVKTKDNEETQIYYNNDMSSIEHGAESLRRMLNLGINISEPWQIAVAYHMGVYNASQTETINFSRMASKFPEVLLLHHADALSAAVYEK